MNACNRPSSTQEDILADASEESEQEDESPPLTRRRATTANENTPPPLTQNTANTVETLFLIKQEERHEFLHNSANKAGYQVLEDGTKAWGLTQEQREALDSTTGQEDEATKENTSPSVITRKGPPVNPYIKPKPKARSDPPASQTIAITSTPPPTGTNASTAIARSTTTTLATLPSPPVYEDSDDDSNEDIAKNISSNLIDDDCMLFSEKECKTLGTNRGKNTSAYEQCKIATEHRFFEMITNYGGPHLQSLVSLVPAKHCDGRERDYRLYNVLSGERNHDKHTILNKCLVLFGMKALCLSL